MFNHNSTLFFLLTPWKNCRYCMYRQLTSGNILDTVILIYFSHITTSAPASWYTARSDHNYYKQFKFCTMARFVWLKCVLLHRKSKTPAKARALPYLCSIPRSFIKNHTDNGNIFIYSEN